MAEKEAETVPVQGADTSAAPTAPTPQAEPEQAPGVALPEAAEGEDDKKGKVSSACCQHPEHKKKKKNPYAQGFGDAIAGDETAKEEVKSEDAEEAQRKADEAESEMIPEEKLIEELKIDTTAEEIDMVQLRIFDTSKVALHLLTNCKKLELRQNLIHEVRPFPANLHASLREMDVYDNKIKAITTDFNVFPHLRVLDLSYNNVRIIENLDIPTLEVLFLTENKITKIQNLDKLPNLKQLELGSNRIRKIENLENLPHLEDLWLGKNKISKLEGIDVHTKLRRLSLQANRLTEVTAEALKHNTSLTDLHLSENGIRQMKNFSHLKKLRLIDFCFNPITEINEVDELPVLEEFWCTDARIANWKEVEKLEKMTTLRTVYLERNPVEDARYRHKLAMLLPSLTEVCCCFQFYFCVLPPPFCS